MFECNQSCFVTVCRVHLILLNLAHTDRSHLSTFFKADTTFYYAIPSFFFSKNVAFKRCMSFCQLYLSLLFLFSTSLFSSSKLANLTKNDIFASSKSVKRNLNIYFLSLSSLFQPFNDGHYLRGVCGEARPPGRGVQQEDAGAERQVLRGQTGRLHAVA